MRRLAVIGDVHGNFAALRAVLKAVRGEGLQNGVCTGDLVMRGTEPDKVVRAIKDLGWPCIHGNTDLKVLDARPPRPPGHPASTRKGSRSWTVRRLSKESLRYLASLPAEARIDLDGHRVVAIHGDTPQPGTLLDESTPDADIVALARELDADCIVSGHTHRPVVRRIGPLLVVNPGSVGEGTADDRRPAWAWIEVVDGVLVPHLERVDEPLALVRDRNAHPS